MQGVVKAKQEDFLYITEKTFINILTAVDCTLVEAEEMFFPRTVAMPVAKGSVYLPLFNDMCVPSLLASLYII